MNVFESREMIWNLMLITFFVALVEKKKTGDFYAAKIVSQFEWLLLERPDKLRIECRAISA